MKTIKIIAGIAAVCLVAVLGLVYSGVYNIGADAPHWPVSARLLELMREHSIERRARGIEVPDLKDPELILAGAGHYAPMCSGCHLAPGVEGTEIRTGLYPQPRNLAQGSMEDVPADAKLAAARQFWIIKHGIKLTAMPAWGTTHDDKSIWALVAFLRRLPELSAAQYQAMIATGNGHSHCCGGDDHSAQPEETDQPPASEPVHQHDAPADSHGAEPEGHHRDTGDGHAHDHGETEQPHSH